MELIIRYNRQGAAFIWIRNNTCKSVTDTYVEIEEPTEENSPPTPVDDWIIHKKFHKNCYHLPRMIHPKQDSLVAYIQHPKERKLSIEVFAQDQEPTRETFILERQKKQPDPDQF